MAEEPTLPKLPTVSWDSETQTFANTRKRAHDRSLAPSIFSNSSDPAVFSSDDDPHVENYTEGRRRKKRYVGSWFQQHPTSSDSTFSEPARPLPKTKRTFQRQFDSGVWMGSDNSVDVEDDATADIKVPTESKLPQLRHARPVTTISPSEVAIRRVIQNAIDSGNPTVDLSSAGIEYISNATISQLSMLDTIPLIDEAFPFESKEPSIALYLSNNPLPRAPGAIFNLENLTILSLRNTRITELPPSIGNLRNLETLNLSLTRLRYLPGELLDLMRFPSNLQTLTIHPNPFYHPDRLEPDSTDYDVWEESLGHGVLFSEERLLHDGSVYRFWLDKQDGYQPDPSTYQDGIGAIACMWEAFALARSPIQYNDSRGTIISKFRLPQPTSPNSVSKHRSHLVIQTGDLSSFPSLPRSTRHQATSTNHSRVPSLFELALQSCARTGQLRELPSYLPFNAPGHLTEVLGQVVKQSEENANSGLLPCSVCKRRVAVPLAQWIEWWQISTMNLSSDGTRLNRRHVGSGENERPIPFLRRGCSWKCLPKPMKQGQRLSGTMKWSREMPEANV
ncbi:hypothetical protein F4677DRAFT_442829 [Hypoxylon crocopeplum]|nr:hypothetical protein F4677DRAFT_442829 [Hypoxylon crocopeplum]